MSYRAVAATNPRVKSVNYIEYYNYQADYSVRLTVNHTIYIGKFPDMAAAEQAVEGLLVKCGCSNPSARRLVIPTDNRAIVPV